MHGLLQRLQHSRSPDVAHAIPQEASVVVLSVHRQASGHRLRQEERLLAQHLLAAGTVVPLTIPESQSEPEERPEDVARYRQRFHHARPQLALEAHLHVLHPGVQLHAAAADARARHAPDDLERRGGPGTDGIAGQSIGRAASATARQAARSE